jgi:hypothetical protein
MSTNVTCPHCGQSCNFAGLESVDLVTCPNCKYVFEFAQKHSPTLQTTADAPPQQKKNCSECLREIPVTARGCRYCGAKASTVGQSPVGGTTPLLAALLGLFCLTRIAQMLMGQIGKGLFILVAAVVLSAFTGGAALIVIHPLVSIDAFMVASRRREGYIVGPWEFFPRKP